MSNISHEEWYEVFTFCDQGDDSEQRLDVLSRIHELLFGVPSAACKINGELTRRERSNKLDQDIATAMAAINVQDSAWDPFHNGPFVVPDTDTLVFSVADDLDLGLLYVVTPNGVVELDVLFRVDETAGENKYGVALSTEQRRARWEVAPGYGGFDASL